MALTRRTVCEVRRAGWSLWKKAKLRAETEWGPACTVEVLSQGIQRTLEARRPEPFSLAADPGMGSAARRLLPLVLHDVLDRSSRYGISANATGRALAQAIQNVAREPRPYSFMPVTEMLRKSGLQPAPYIGNVIRWAGYETSADYVVFDLGNRPRIQMVLREHPSGITPDEIADRTGIELQRVKETLRNDHYAVRTRPGRWTLASGASRPFTNVRSAVRDVIKQAGGRASEEGIVHELEIKYGIRPATTRRITRTRDFLKTGGAVEENTAAEAWSGELQEQADGFSEEGEPYVYWHARGNRAGREGLQIHGIPEVIADHAGGRPNTTTRLAVTSPPGLGDVTLRWSTGEESPVTLRRCAQRARSAGHGTRRPDPDNARAFGHRRLREPGKLGTAGARAPAQDREVPDEGKGTRNQVPERPDRRPAGRAAVGGTHARPASWAWSAKRCTTWWPERNRPWTGPTAPAGGSGSSCASARGGRQAGGPNPAPNGRRNGRANGSDSGSWPQSTATRARRQRPHGSWRSRRAGSRQSCGEMYPGSREPTKSRSRSK